MLSGSNRVTLNELSEERLPYTRYARFGRQCSFKRVPRLLLKGSTFAFGGVHTLKLWPLMQPQKESRLWSNSLWGNKPTDNIHHLRWKSMIYPYSMTISSGFPHCVTVTPGLDYLIHVRRWPSTSRPQGDGIRGHGTNKISNQAGFVLLATLSSVLWTYYI